MADRILIKDALLPIQYVNANGEIKTLDPKVILKFNKNDLDFDKQANYYYLIARLADMKQRELDDYKVQVDSLYAQLYQAYMNSDDLKKANNNRKPSEAMITSGINNDQNYIKAQRQLNKLSNDSKLLVRFLKALELKMSMMQSESAMQRVDFTKRS